MDKIITHPLTWIAVGAALLIESLMTPGFQPVSSMLSGALMGWNISRLFAGDC